MGYRSNVYLKTTTEGWLVIKRFNNSIKDKDERPLQYAEVNKTSSGFYKIEFIDVKWYEGSYPEVDNFMTALEKLADQDIPYSYIRIGEDTADIEHKNNYTDDMPDELITFEPVADVNDDDYGDYKKVDLDEDEEDKDSEDTSHITKVMFDLFNEYEECDDIKYALRSMNSDGDVTNEEYDYAIEHWDVILKLWEATQSSK